VTHFEIEIEICYFYVPILTCILVTLSFLLFLDQPPFYRSSLGKGLLGRLTLAADIAGCDVG
jgi:hypothetical protein